MRKMFSLLRILWMLAAFASCIYDPPCERPLREENLDVLPQWTDETSRPARVWVDAYSQSGEGVIRNFIPSSGGSIYLPAGEHRLLLYSNTSSYIHFRHIEAFDMAEAYVDGGGQPDELYCGNAQGVNVSPPNGKQQVRVPMMNMVQQYPFIYDGVVGLQHVTWISVTIDGINLAVKMGSRIPTPETSTIECPYTLTPGGFYGTFRCFGHSDPQTKHTFTVYFGYAGRTSVHLYDVTRMLNERGRIDLTDFLVFEPLDPGNVDTGVGDWGDDIVDIPIHK